MEINMNQDTLEKMTSLRLRGIFNAFRLVWKLLRKRV